jgi:hypothetical protein
MTFKLEPKSFWGTDDETYYVDSQGEQWRIHVDDGPPGEVPVKADVPGCSVRLVRHMEREFVAAAAVVEAMVAERMPSWLFQPSYLPSPLGN